MTTTAENNRQHEELREAETRSEGWLRGVKAAIDAVRKYQYETAPAIHSGVIEGAIGVMENLLSGDPPTM
jgi:hypothetical protein